MIFLFIYKTWRKYTILFSFLRVFRTMNFLHMHFQVSRLYKGSTTVLTFKGSVFSRRVSKKMSLPRGLVFQRLFFVTHFTENTNIDVGITKSFEKFQITQSTLSLRLLFIQQENKSKLISIVRKQTKKATRNRLSHKKQTSSIPKKFSFDLVYFRTKNTRICMIPIIIIPFINRLQSRVLTRFVIA